MKNSIKAGLLALVITVSLAACKSKSGPSAADSIKMADSIKTADSLKAATADSGKMKTDSGKMKMDSGKMKTDSGKMKTKM